MSSVWLIQFCIIMHKYNIKKLMVSFAYTITFPALTKPSMYYMLVCKKNQ